MTLRLVEFVEAARSGTSGKPNGSSHGHLRVRPAQVEGDGLSSPLALGEVREHRALHLLCHDPADLDGLAEFDSIRFDYIAVALGRGLDSAAHREALLGRLEHLATLMKTPVLWQTARGSIGQNLLVVQGELRARPRLRLALDYPEMYCAHDMVLGRYGRWNDVLTEIGPRTTTMIVGDGDSARDARAARPDGLVSFPPRWVYGFRQNRANKALAPQFICRRNNL